MWEVSRNSFPLVGVLTFDTDMPLLASFLPALDAGHDLTADQVALAAAELASPEVPEGEKAAFLRALAKKGESAGEVAAFAKEFRARATNPGVERWAPGAIDIVGTGGDHAGGFNVSSLVVLTLASLGVKVMKHGNRGITSKCGSADLMSALGFNIEAPPARLQDALDQLGYVFFFAPAYHPSFKHIGPVRKALAAEGQRTIFNILGPLINPGRPAHLILGVFSESWVPRLAAALDDLGLKSGLVVHGRLGPERGIDELTSTSPNRVCGFGQLKGLDEVWESSRFGVEARPFADLVGGDLAHNMTLVEALLAGRGPQGLADTIVLNTATALWVTGRTSSVADGVAPAREALLGGAVRAKIAATREFFA